jgi:hypothetical protein
MQYRNEMPIGDIGIASELEEIIDYLIEKKIKKLKFDKHYSAKVVAVYYGTADISLYDSTNIIKNVKVKDGLSLNVGDEIYVLAINGSLNNLIIDIKK